jgi:hypothetical protein
LKEKPFDVKLSSKNDLGNMLSPIEFFVYILDIGEIRHIRNKQIIYKPSFKGWLINKNWT